MKNNLIVRLEGGLGNQLFQYANARSLQLKYGGKLQYDLHAFNSKQIRSFALQHFNIPQDINPIHSSLWNKILLSYFRSLSRIYRKIELCFPSINNETLYHLMTKMGIYHQYRVRAFDHLSSPLLPCNYVTGNWLSPKFFHGNDELLRKELTIKEKLKPECEDLLKRIESCQSICVHVRLGDYLAPEWKDKLYICRQDYYREGVAYIKSKVKDPVFFVFSNRHKDIEWIKENYHLDGEIVYVDYSNADYEDMKLMYSCKHFIMSNSTYSWWAQYLSTYKDKIVVAPSRFNNYPQWDMTDIYLDSWHLINV